MWRWSWHSQHTPRGVGWVQESCWASPPTSCSIWQALLLISQAPVISMVRHSTGQRARCGSGSRSLLSLMLWYRLASMCMQCPLCVSVPTPSTATGRSHRTETPSLQSGPPLVVCCCYWRSHYTPDTLLLAALEDDIFKTESFRELPFSFSALISQRFQCQLEVIISSVNLQVTPTLLL